MAEAGVASMVVLAPGTATILAGEGQGAAKLAPRHRAFSLGRTASQGVRRSP
jgi:hypothetical protein